MRRSVRLRPWQKRALEQLAGSASIDFLAVATPGAGKTTFAITAAITALHEAPHRRVVVVAPTQHLKTQWVAAAADLGLQLDPAWSARSGAPRDTHGIVVTYQQVAADPARLASVAAGAFAVFDELHHAGEERAWGEALREAFEGSVRRLALSGTPFRSDTHAIPFVRYAGDEACPDFVYGYADALADGGVVRPVRFPRVDGEMEWTAPDGARHAHTFSDRLDRARASHRLRTALSVDGDWLPEVLVRADRTLRGVREDDPDAGGLVVAVDQEHARGIARLLAERVGAEPVVAISEDASASLRIARFAAGQGRWIVAVRMVSEGVDIPRLRVGVFATTVMTELFFRQVVGRLVRWRPGLAEQTAHLFVPDDTRLRAFAADIAAERRHSLVRSHGDGADEEGDDEQLHAGADEPDGEGAQLSLFAPISAVALGEAAGAPSARDRRSDVEQGRDDPTLLVDLLPPPLEDGHDEDRRPREARRRDLREANAARVAELARLTGRGHRELNRLAGIRRVGDATLSELRARIDQADRWIRRL